MRAGCCHCCLAGRKRGARRGVLLPFCVCPSRSSILLLSLLAVLVIAVGDVTQDAPHGALQQVVVGGGRGAVVR